MTEPDEAFYDERLLPLPDREYRPDNVAQLREIVEDSGAIEPDHALVALGGGEHLRSSAIGERRFDVVRVDGCERIRELDRESNTVRVEAGASWQSLRDRLADEGRSVHAYGLQPAEATVGGLLGRWQPAERQLHRGDIREGCIALRTASPAGADYNYLAAPRKASGPDHRFLYIGGEAALGVILEATLVVQPDHPGVLMQWEAPEIGDAVELFRQLAHLDIRVGWSRWTRSEARYEAVFHAPAGLMEEKLRRLRTKTGREMEVERGAAVEERCRALETDHPAARSTEGAETIWRGVWTLSRLPDAIEALSSQLEDVVVEEWGPQHATVYLKAGEANPAWRKRREPFQAALADRAIVDGGEAIWPAWVQRLKAELDPEGRLAVGP
ncbi:MAG: FAD-binding oxidoreductase [Bradymonadaceae bacterium]